MNKRFMLGIFVLFILSLVSVAVIAQDDVAREDTVIFDYDRTATDPENFNPFTSDGRNLRGNGAHQSMWEPLFILNYETGSIDPWLGLSMQSNEALDVWTLTLRDGVTWSDGEAFNAEDVVYTIEMLISEAGSTLPGSEGIGGVVDSVEAIDDLTVQFNLTGPNPRFQLDFFSVRSTNSILIMPEHIWADEDPTTFTFYADDGSMPIGTGPYTLTSSETNRWVWDRNDDWWGVAAGFNDLPEPLRLIWLSVSSEDNRVQLMANNDTDAANSVTLAAFEAIQARNPNVIAWETDLPYSWSDPCPRQLDINTTVAPWDNPNMRQALSLLIDRQEIVDFAYEGTTIASRSLFVEYGSMEPFISAVAEAGYAEPVNADVETAQALIEAEGYTLNNAGFYELDGEELSVEILVNNASTEYTSTVEIIVEQLRAAGIDAFSRQVDNGTFWGSAAPESDYEVAYGWLACGSVNEPFASLGRYGTEGRFNNTGLWSGDGYDAFSAIVEEIGTRPLDDPEIPDLVVEAYSYIDAETPIVPLVQATKLLPFNTTYWEGWPTAENNYNHPAFWWNHTHQIIHNLTKAG
ncbi:MAG: ABC transporter substrate-binding protein [Anaerolineae bacterium]